MPPLFYLSDAERLIAGHVVAASALLTMDAAAAFTPTIPGGKLFVVAIVGVALLLRAIRLQRRLN